MGQVPATAWRARRRVAVWFSCSRLKTQRRNMTKKIDGKRCWKKTWENMGQALRIGGWTYVNVQKDVEKQWCPIRIYFQSGQTPHLCVNVYRLQKRWPPKWSLAQIRPNPVRPNTNGLTVPSHIIRKRFNLIPYDLSYASKCDSHVVKDYKTPSCRCVYLASVPLSKIMVKNPWKSIVSSWKSPKNPIVS